MMASMWYQGITRFWSSEVDDCVNMKMTISAQTTCSDGEKRRLEVMAMDCQVTGWQAFSHTLEEILLPCKK